MLLLMFFFFNETATTEIYTYLHTLSLHDALPIVMAEMHQLHMFMSPGSTAGAVGAGRARRSAGAWSTAPNSRWVKCVAQTAKGWLSTSRSTCSRARLRSEEHKSELQSLMRITYAVF